ncbi:MAG TPA: hypothetical protein VMS04_15685 [Vicinamibacterales bacterium]|jgi:hypothetical protein|nr:hypothetical protein [Vicinamibacterales bacterium]
MSLVAFLIWLLVLVIIAGLGWWIIGQFTLPEPVGKLVRIVFVVVICVILIVLLLNLVGVAEIGAVRLK